MPRDILGSGIHYEWVGIVRAIHNHRFFSSGFSGEKYHIHF